MAPRRPDLSAISFGSYRLEGPDGLLWRRNRVVALSPKAVAILWHLASQAGQLVRKAALFEAVWPATAVTEGVLAVRIRELRRALDDDPQRPHYIETVHRRGYRFVGALRARPSAVSPSRAPVTTSVWPPALRISDPQPCMPIFVGREAELARLSRCYELTRKGHRQVIFVTGDAGMGKTTLVDALTTQLAQEGHVWLGRGQCVEQYGAGEAYLPLLEALSHLCHGPAAAPVITRLRQYAPSWLAQLDAALEEEERATLRHQVQGVTQTRMLRELAEALEALTTAQPAALVLEDLHWSDYSTVEALTMLARRREAARLLVIGTYRPVELVLRAHPLKAVKQELQLHGQCDEVPLGYLTRAEVQAYLDQRVAGPAATAALATWVHRRTEGHPLFMVHVVDDLAQQGRLTDPAATEASGGGVEAAVPAALPPLIELQLARLSGEVQQVLDVASVVGVEFAVASVAASLCMPIDAIEAICEELARQGQFIEDLGLAEWPDGTVSGRYGFRHALYQEVLYRRIGSARRVRWHRAIGARLEVGYGAQASQLAAALAVHFEQGRDHARAVDYLRQAAADGIQRATYPEALQNLTKAFAPRHPAGYPGARPART
jgi:predicted ATPase/DNA-binding winged helix-turn-helix (wHTH) protein